jgi:hypothetical protein
VIADITMSLDGYVTGPGADARHGLGDAEELHTWVVDQDPVDTEILERATRDRGRGHGAAAVRRRRGTRRLDRGDGVRRAGGTPLFRAGTRQMYRQGAVRPSSNAVHLTYERV